MKRHSAISVAVVSAAAIWALMSSVAFASPTYGVCTGCHPKSASVSVKATQTANTGGKATYSFTVTSPGSTVGWAVFDGSTNIANGHGKTGTFTVTDGKTYALWVRDTSVGTASTSLSPAAPPVTPPADKTAPTTVSNAKATYADSATIKLTATDNAGGSGVAHTYYKLDGGVQTEGTTIVVTAPGSHTLAFWSLDASGNAETPKTAAFTITVTPPPSDPPTTPPSTPPTTPVTPPVVSGTCDFVVHVVGEEHHGVRGATVVLTNTTTRRSYALRSSRTGWAVFAKLPLGTYKVRVVLGERVRTYKPVTVGKARQSFLIRLY
jgi:hypothetical protein